MEKKILGIILSILGISGLILALVFMNASGSSDHLHLLLAGGTSGAILFFTGIWLIPGRAVL